MMAQRWRAVATCLALALLGACGSDRCEIPQLIVSPSEARPGDEVEVRPDGSLAPCHQEGSDTLFRPVPRDTFELHLMLVPGRARPDGSVRPEGDPIEWGTVGFDEEVGTFSFDAKVPAGLAGGEYSVYVAEQSEAKGRLRILLGSR